jgi:hypothetical protein
MSWNSCAGIRPPTHISREPDSTLAEGGRRTLRDPFAGAIAEEDAWLDGVRTRIRALAPESLSDASRIDRDVTLAQIAFLCVSIRGARYQERRDRYLHRGAVSGGGLQLQGMSQTGAASYGTDGEWELTIQRVKAIPVFLARAREATPCRGPVGPTFPTAG